MAGEKALLKRIEVRPSGKQHRCRQSANHLLPKGCLMLVVIEGRKESHYCVECAHKFMSTAHAKLDSVAHDLGG